MNDPGWCLMKSMSYHRLTKCNSPHGFLDKNLGKILVKKFKRLHDFVIKSKILVRNPRVFTLGVKRHAIILQAASFEHEPFLVNNNKVLHVIASNPKFLEVP